MMVIGISANWFFDNREQWKQLSSPQKRVISYLQEGWTLGDECVIYPSHLYPFGKDLPDPICLQPRTVNALIRKGAIECRFKNGVARKP